MSRHSDALATEIANAERAMRRADESGRPTDALIAATRAQALRWAEWFLFGDGGPCLHPSHRWVGQTDRGVAIWQCNECDDVYPPGAIIATDAPTTA